MIISRRPQVVALAVSLTLGFGLALVLLTLLIRPPILAVPAAVPPLPVKLSRSDFASPGDRARETLAHLPLRFIANAGGEQRFTVQATGYTIFFAEGEVVFSTSPAVPPAAEHSLGSSHHLTVLPDPHPQPAGRASAVVRLRFAGANPHPAVEGLERLPGAVNFFLGNDPAAWQTGLPSYAAIVYRDLYPSVDLVYRGSGGRLKSEFRLAPGADPAAIQMVYAGLQEARVRADGALVLQTAAGELVEKAPFVYQVGDGARREIAGGYELRPPDRPGGAYRVTFQVAAYDQAQPLVIDPALVFSTYLGGEGAEWGFGIAVDSAGSIYVAGGTESTDFPTANPIQIDPNSGNAFVTQIISSGGAYTYGFSTFLGGSDADYGYDIALDEAGNIYVAGETRSSDFPIRQATQPSRGGGAVYIYDAFVTQIISAGGSYTLGFSTYLGGSADDRGGGVAVDGDGNIYIKGSTQSSDFPCYDALDTTLGGSFDGFATKIISASGAYTYGYSTYLGGSGMESIYPGLEVDGAGNAYVTGGTFSSDFPLHDALDTSLDGLSDAFVTQIISAAGTYTYGLSTYLGGSSTDSGGSVAVDNAGRIYVTGETTSSDFPTRNALNAGPGGNGDVFVTQIASAGGVYTYGFSSFFGGSSRDGGVAIAVDDAGTMYVMGSTESGDFPYFRAIDTSLSGDTDVFVTKIVSAGGVYTVGYSTYLGGGGYERGFDIAVDDAGNSYVTGDTNSSDFPTRHASQMRQAYTDAFVAKIGPCDRCMYLPVIWRRQ
jgi:hypothetical protein